MLMLLLGVWVPQRDPKLADLRYWKLAAQSMAALKGLSAAHDNERHHGETTAERFTVINIKYYRIFVGDIGARADSITTLVWQCHKSAARSSNRAISIDCTIKQRVE